MALGSFEAVVRPAERGTVGRAAAGVFAGLLLCAAVIAVAQQPSSVDLVAPFFLTTSIGKEGLWSVAAFSRTRRRPELVRRASGSAREHGVWFALIFCAETGLLDRCVCSGQGAATSAIAPADPHLAALARDTDDRGGLQSLFKGMARQVHPPLDPPATHPDVQVPTCTMHLSTITWPDLRAPRVRHPPPP